MKLLLLQYAQAPVNLYSVQIFSAPCSQTPSAYVPPSIEEAKVHTYTEPQAKL
jgi:hypothetical protein